jgi:pantothenate kinase-related protein Tda10
MSNREPRQIVSFDVQMDKKSFDYRVLWTKQHGLKSTAQMETQHILTWFFRASIFAMSATRKTRSQSKALMLMRHYIPLLRRHSRCFARKIETPHAVVSVFVDTYSKFGAAKMKFRQNRAPNSRELPFSLSDFL